MSLRDTVTIAADIEIKMGLHSARLRKLMGGVDSALRSIDAVLEHLQMDIGKMRDEIQRDFDLSIDEADEIVGAPETTREAAE